LHSTHALIIGNGSCPHLLGRGGPRVLRALAVPPHPLRPRNGAVPRQSSLPRRWRKLQPIRSDEHPSVSELLHARYAGRGRPTHYCEGSATAARTHTHVHARARAHAHTPPLKSVGNAPPGAGACRQTIVGSEGQSIQAKVAAGPDGPANVTFTVGRLSVRPFARPCRGGAKHGRYR